MGSWNVETQDGQLVLTHTCAKALPYDGTDVLHQDIGGGYIRCERCGEKFLPPDEPGNPRYIMRLQRAETHSGATA